MKRYFLISLLALSVCRLSMAQEEKTLDTGLLMDKLSVMAEGLQSIESRFEQVKHLDVFDTEIRSSGKFCYKKENKICLDYQKPVPYLLVINESKIKIVSDGKTNRMDLGENPMMNEVGVLLTACMTGDFSGALNSYRMTAYETETYYRLSIIPVSEMIKAYIAGFDIKLNKKDLSVDFLRIQENETDYTDYIFTDKRFNALNDDAIFSVD